MDEIIKFLKSMGLGDKEIEKVLRETPVNPEGLTGTNVATGVFTKTNPKSKEFVKDFPLVVEKIGNPFEVNYYKGKSREETIRMAEDNVKFLENEITKLADQILNKNLKLTEEQKINLTKNLATKRKIEKDLETFKTTPDAPVVDIKTGETVKDVETLKEKSGLVAPPTTDLGRIDLRNKQMLQKAEEFYKSQDDFQKEEVKRQALIAKQYEGKGYEGGVFGPSGMYRSVARNFLLDQHAKGKIKLTDDVIKNLEERNYISGGQPLLYPDPIRIMRLHYGDDVFEKIPLDKIKTGAPSEIIEEMSKIKINPVKVEAPATPGGYMTPGEIQANIEELENIEKIIKRRESRFADMTDEQIKNELEHYGSQKNAFEIAFGYDHPKEYEEYLKLKNLEDPKKFAKGGSVESLGLDYLTGIERDYPERSNFKEGSIPKMVKFFIDKLVEEKNFNRQLLEKTNPMLVKEMYIEKFGKLPSAEELKEIINKQLQNKGSMETVNPKTGEVTTPKEPVTIADKKRQLTKEEIEDYEEAIGRNSEEWMSEGTIEEAEKALKRSKDEEAYYRTQYKLGKLDPAPGEKTEARMKFLQKKFDEVLATGDRRHITLEEAQELQELQFASRRKPKGMSLEEEMNMILNQYDKSMFIKNEQGMVDVTNPENVRKMALLLKRDHPEFYKKLEGGVQTNILEDFDVTGRKPNAVGGRVGFEKGSIPEEEDQEPSEEYIKSREAGRFKYSFDVQGPDSRIKKSGLPGRTNPKDYGLGITYLPNPSNETAPEIRVGASRRGAGVEIRKKFKDGGLGYLMGE